MQWAIHFYSNHSLDGPMDASWSENAKCYENFYSNAYQSLSSIAVINPKELCVMLRTKL